MKFISSFAEADLETTDHIFVLAPLAFIKAHADSNPIGDIPGWPLVKAALADTKKVKLAKSFTTYTGKTAKQRLTVTVVTDEVSRGVSPAKKEWLYGGLAELNQAKNPLVIAVVQDASFIGAATTAAARRLRLFSTKTSGDSAKDKGKKDKAEPKVTFLATDPAGKPLTPSAQDKAVVESVRWCCDMVDRPPTDLNPKAYSKAIKKWFADDENVSFDEIVGKDLLDKNMGGIHAVGRTAIEAPRMVILDYTPGGKKAKAGKNDKVFGLVGKGLTYDTGGLSLKISGSMEGMKVDMAGSAAIVAAFKTLVACDFPHRVIAIVGLAENAIGPDAYKPDDILHMYSGKSVEINNTDAEGRLVLADCLAYLCETYKPDYLFDAATLTGAQLIATGVMHAAVIANDASAEQALIDAAVVTGDQVAPLPFAPEFFNSEFESQVADMTNSVKSRMNGGTCCAGVFLHNHIEDKNVKWAHIDLAGPSSDKKGLGTGFGTYLIAKAVTLLG